VRQDRIRLDDVLARIELEDGHAPVAIAREVLGRASLALEEVDRHALERELELAQQDPGLHAVPGRRVVVQDHARNLACLTCAVE
jgi:hypothetical protein